MKPIPATAEILAFKMLGRSIDKRWIDWAYDMVNAGFDNENLLILAGELPPYNQFELQRITDKVFNELNLAWDNREVVLKNYICYLIVTVFNEETKALNVLDIVKNIYIELDYEPFLSSFFMLYYANDDLKYFEHQWYWDGATRENIDKVIEEYFRNWLAGCRET